MLDFDDLILLPTLLLQRNEEVRERWQKTIRYLLVDEYQDTNTSQYELVKLLVGQRARFTVVGDDDQFDLLLARRTSAEPVLLTKTSPRCRSLSWSRITVLPGVF
ncbi:UvrD-helicase domain-containing protein [Shigella flexneri]